MSNKVKGINTKNRAYYFFNDITNIENFDPNNIHKDKNSYKNIFIYYTGNVTVKEYVQIYNVNPLYRYVNGYFEEVNENTYLTLVRINESKEKIKKNLKNLRFS